MGGGGEDVLSMFLFGPSGQNEGTLVMAEDEVIFNLMFYV